MNTTKLITLLIAVIFILSIMLLIIKFLLRKIKNKGIAEGKIKPSLGISFTSLFLGSSLASSKAIYIFAEALDNIYKIKTGNVTAESAKTGSLFIGFTAIWFIVWYLIVSILSITITGKRNEEKEIESDNYSYFLIKGILFIGFILCLLPVFEMILRFFMPGVEIPFYH